MIEFLEDASTEEMWQVIEEFGIKREILDRLNPKLLSVSENNTGQLK